MLTTEMLKRNYSFNVKAMNKKQKTKETKEQ